MANSRSQVKATDGAPGAKQLAAAAADTAGRGAARPPVPRALALASVALLLILFVSSAVLPVRAYVLYEGASSTTSGVTGATDGLLIELLNAETGQRGYLLTNKAMYLQPYDRALSTVPAAQQLLGSQVSAVPGGRQYFVELRNLVTAKMAELARTISLARR